MGTGATVDVAGGAAMEGANSILRVIVENMIYPITLDVLQQVKGHLEHLHTSLHFSILYLYADLLQVW